MSEDKRSNRLKYMEAVGELAKAHHLNWKCTRIYPVEGFGWELTVWIEDDCKEEWNQEMKKLNRNEAIKAWALAIATIIGTMIILFIVLGAVKHFIL